jgi:hypothetical protein
LVPSGKHPNLLSLRGRDVKAPAGRTRSRSAGSLLSEQYLLDIEREAFLSLCVERKTQERIAFTPKTGKPLRNQDTFRVALLFPLKLVILTLRATKGKDPLLGTEAGEETRWGVGDHSPTTSRIVEFTAQDKE